MRNARSWFAAIAILGGLVAPGRAIGQGSIGVQPSIGVIPDGVSLSATPAVSADRRYVRVSVGAAFSTVQGFQNINFPVGAVGMGGGRLGGGFGGLGGGGGGGSGAGQGGGAGGFMSVLTGMNGPVSSAGSTPIGPQAMAPVGYGTGFDESAGAFSPEVQPRRAAPRKSRADRAKAERVRAAAAKADVKPDAATKPPEKPKK